MKVEIRNVEKIIVESGAVIELSAEEATLLRKFLGSVSRFHVCKIVTEDVDDIYAITSSLYNKLIGF
jgi:hypothetical protein